jgi:hypothetical protein
MANPDQIQGILRWSEMIREALDDSHMLSNWLVSQMWRIRSEPSYSKPSIQQFSTDLLEVAGRCGTRPAARSSLDWREERPLEHDLRDLEEDHLAIINIPPLKLMCSPFVCKFLENHKNRKLCRGMSLCHALLSEGNKPVILSLLDCTRSGRGTMWEGKGESIHTSLRLTTATPWKMCNGYVRSVNKPRNWKNSLYWWNRRS